MNLLEAQKGIALTISSIGEGKLSEDAMRFGIEEGEEIKIISKLPGGPVVIQKNYQQIAIGKEIAKTIKVQITNKTGRSVT